MIITTLKRYSLIYSRRSSVKNVKQFMSCFYFKPFTTLRKIRPLYAVLESHMWHGPDHQPFWFHSDRQEATPLTSSPCRKHTTLKDTYSWWQPEVVPINDKRSYLLPERWIRSDSPKPKPTLFLTVRGKKKSPTWKQVEGCPSIISMSCWNSVRHVHQRLCHHSLGWRTLSELLFSTD